MSLVHSFFTMRGKSPLSFLAVSNLLMALVWGASVLLSYYGFPYLAPLAGVVVLFVPGYLMALALEQMGEARMKLGIFVLWGAIFSVLLTPAATYSLSVLFGATPVTLTLQPFLLWWATVLVATSAIFLVKRQPSILTVPWLVIDQKREVGYILAAFTAVLGLNFIIYPFLPEADGYGYLIKWDRILANSTLFAAETRSLFLVFTHLAAQVLRVDMYWVFKVLLPLMHVTIVLSCYLFARQFIADSRYRILLALVPLCFPVVLQEVLMSRPQSIFLITFLPALVVLSDLMQNRSNVRQVYWLLALLIVSGIGLRVHTLFTLLVVISALSFCPFFKKEIVHRPLDAAMVAAGVLAFLYPHIVQTRILSDSWDVLKLIATSLQNGTFEVWFIDRYRNVDGAESGWPGVWSLFYYGYNLGLAFPVIVLGVLSQQRFGLVRTVVRDVYWAILLVMAFFFFIAEVAPRFQLAYLPDRAWLFMALVFALTMPIMVKDFIAQDRAWFFKLSVVVAVVSVFVGTGLTYAKQGWVTREEVAAARFIREQLPENALFLGQGSGRVMVRYYAKREFIRPAESVFAEGDKAAVEAYVASLDAAYLQTLDAIPRRRAELAHALGSILEGISMPELTEAELLTLFNRLNILSEQRDQYVSDIRFVQSQQNRQPSIYLVYNQNKFSSLYGGRSWWRGSNFYGANTDGLTESYPVVYQENGITIWEVRK